MSEELILFQLKPFQYLCKKGSSKCWGIPW